MVGEGSTCDVYCAAGDACVRECVAEPAPGVQDLIAGLVLLGCSGLFSGLTLGLMSLDPAGLEVIIAGGDPVGKSQAERILPLRKHGNLLLCSLLLGNTLVNALLAILTASFTSGLLGGVLSSAAILVFGEILPQSVCSRHGLYIGSKVVDLVRVLMALALVVAWPISKVLDLVLGEELGTVYSRRELKELFTLQARKEDSESSTTRSAGGDAGGAASYRLASRAPSTCRLARSRRRPRLRARLLLLLSFLAPP